MIKTKNDLESQPASLLLGAYDLHVHCSPDVVPRAQDLVDLATAAHRAGMAGVGLKDHTTCTVGRCYALNRQFSNGPRFFSSIAMNPPVGGLNPAAVEAALTSGADIVYFPTYSARHHIEVLGADVTPVPHPRAGVQAISVLDQQGQLESAAAEIVRLIVEFDAVLATGHLSPAESLRLLRFAAECGAKRMIVTHASESVPDMSVEDQRQAVELGAFIEHCFLAATPCCPGNIPLSAIADQIQQLGPQHVILSSDFGQPANGPPITSFGEHVDRLEALGFASAEIRQMIVANPAKLMEGRHS